MASACVSGPAITISRILFATDFSETATRAIPHVARIAKHFGATLFPVHVLPSEPRYEVPLDPLNEELCASHKTAEHRMACFIDNAVLRDIPKQIEIERGEVAACVRDMIDRYGIDLVAVATHGHGSVGKILFGSVAEEIFRRSPCPVLIVGPHISDGSEPVRRVLFTTDLSTESLASLRFAVDLANSLGAFFRILHVVQESRDTVFNPDVLKKKRAFLEKALASFSFVHEPEVIIEVGAIGDAVLKCADTYAIGLILMGARTAAAPSLVSHIPASITHFVASHAHCPVLAMRIGRAATESVPRPGKEEL